MSSPITKNKRYFDSCLHTAQSLFKEKLFDDCASYLQELSTFAWKNFTGYYTNWKLEHMLNQLGKECSLSRESEKIKTKKELSVLHIVTEIYKTGGHTQLVRNWIEIDKKNKHTIIATRMDQNTIVDMIGVFSEKNQVELGVLKSESILLKSKELKALVGNYDRIILHIHPDDVIPVIALSDKNNKVPVLFLNHADHVFWIGMSVTDCLIQIREPNIKLDKERRGADFQMFLPIPIVNNQKGENEAKTDFFKKEGEVILLSTGSGYKYHPYKNHNFFQAAYKIVESLDNVIFFVAGVSPENELAKQYSHERLIYLGEITNLSQYENLCDIYVEGFPMASFTALLQVAIKGRYVQFMYQPLNIFRLFEDNKENDCAYPESFERWFNDLSLVIKNSDIRNKKQKNQYRYIENVYNVKYWRKLLEDIYKSTEILKHKVTSKKRSNCYFGRDEEFLTTLYEKQMFRHYRFCSKLSFLERVKVVMRSRFRTKDVIAEQKKVPYFLFKK
jgi:hypothetical protein